MKLVFLLFMAIVSTSAFACPDLSGEFTNEEFGTYYSISQNGCELIEFHYDEGTISAQIDGIERLESEFEVEVEAGKILANIKIYISYIFKGSKLLTNQRVVTTYTSDGKIEEDKSWAETFLNDDTDLVNIYHDDAGTLETVDVRVK